MQTHTIEFVSVAPSGAETVVHVETVSARESRARAAYKALCVVYPPARDAFLRLKNEAGEIIEPRS